MVVSGLNTISTKTLCHGFWRVLLQQGRELGSLEQVHQIECVSPTVAGWVAVNVSCSVDKGNDNACT